MNTKRSFLEKWDFCKNNYYNTDFKLPVEWLQSFFDGEGNFNFFLKDNNSATIEFSVSQNVHDYYKMKLIPKFFGEGNI
jgi:intein-encoded DNA endonuclease-like protein